MVVIEHPTVSQCQFLYLSSVYEPSVKFLGFWPSEIVSGVFLG